MHIYVYNNKNVYVRDITAFSIIKKVLVFPKLFSRSATL